MTLPAKPNASQKPPEERFDEIRNAAAGAARPNSAGGRPPAHPQIDGKGSYYGLPVLKAPVWTWEVPAYFFVGGIAGMAACLAFAAQLFGGDEAVVRAALWIAMVGALICPALLISDLGRPSRFLNMLRVAKIQSPMSVGAWTLVVFSGCVFAALFADEFIMRGYTNPPRFTQSTIDQLITAIRWAGECAGALTGLLLASYTGVLIGATANPVWSHNRRALPPQFLAAGLGGAGGVLELMGFLTPATQFLGMAAAAIETLLAVYFELNRAPVNAPLHRGTSAWAFRVAALLAGPVALLARVIGDSAGSRRAAAVCFLAGSLLTRFAWIWAGRISAKDPEVLFQMQR